MKIKGYILLVFGLMTASHAFSFSSDTLKVQILGIGEDARFSPVVLQVQPGDVILFEVVEGLHTVTSYHPDNRRPLRIPTSAQSFDSGMLNKGDRWFLEIKEEGVYDYFCIPHERLGHAGRIISGTSTSADYDDSLIPVEVAKTLKSGEVTEAE
ncbi:MAG: hypothetical protein CL670_08710 [Balneola sp.]|jgi:plastocyanin|nr:hypothetical protein [Balneola sp.]MBE79220.1 hypothetical protein [Balneola sp.]|tara:strand:- start:295 stop:756 length:462 start_codon:yes stop_codon:yes gene_type:complete